MTNWEQREQELDALLDAEDARIKKLMGHTLTKSELQSLSLPRPPDWAMLWDALSRLPDKPLDTKLWEEGATEAMIVLIGSDVPLSSPTRLWLADKLREFCFPTLCPTCDRRQRNRSLARQLENEKRELLKRHVGMSKAKAERLTAEKYKITTDALRQKLKRANRN